MGATHAVVLGAGFAGLLAARVLVDYYDRVTIVERDRLPAKAEVRTGVPQARHVHVLLLRGQYILERLFPGLQTELAAAGAPSLNWSHDWAIFQHGTWAPHFISGYAGCTCSRDLLEAVVRARLRKIDQVRWLERHEAIGLVAIPDGGHVVGVELNRRHGGVAQDQDMTTLAAALVVDASGRESRTPQWLAALGYPVPSETTINSFRSYASRWYRRPVAHTTEWQALLIAARPPDQPRTGLLCPVEGDRWLVSLIGIGEVTPPLDEAGFLNFARSLPHPAIYEAIKEAVPLTPIYGYRRTENRLRHYERLSKLPEGLVLLGDAVCTFNPVYGQGMTVCALAAEALDQTLREHRCGRAANNLTGFAKRFQKRLADVNATPWLMATGADLNWPTTIGGQRSMMDRLVQRYVERVRRLVAEDVTASRVLLEVLHLLRPSTTLFQPRLLRAVLRQALFSKGRTAKGDSPVNYTF